MPVGPLIEASVHACCKHCASHSVSGPLIHLILPVLESSCAPGLWQVTPAPDIPPEVERQFQRLEWVTYRLRRAYLEGTPSQPVQALASAGLTPPLHIHSRTSCCLSVLLQVI